MQLIIQSPAPVYQRSLDFYKSIHFDTLYTGDNQSIVSDGQATILVNGANDARLGLVAYLDDYEVVVQRFKDAYNVVDVPEGTMTADPNGVRLYLKSMEMFPELKAEASKSLVGSFAGLGVETLYMDKSMEFWRRLGYKVPDSENQSYATLTSPFMPALTLYSPGICPHAFYNPSLTYFNGKAGNPIVIDNIRKAGIIATEDITVFNPNKEVDNIIIGDPGGLHYFVFND